MKRSPDIIIVLFLGLLIFGGMVIEYSKTPYVCEFTLDVDGDTVRYEYDANYGVETTTTFMRSDAGFHVDSVLFYYDEAYAALNSWDYQKGVFEDMSMNLGMRGVHDVRLADSDQIQAAIADRANHSNTAIFIASGSISEKIYDGTENCPLVRWLDSGGVVVSMGTCLGKYVSHGPDADDIEEVSGYGAIFAGADDSVFLDGSVPAYVGGDGNPEVIDALDVHFNEVTYGVDISKLDVRFMTLGHTSDEGLSSATLLESRNGMVMSFGMVLESHVHTGHYVAQIIASGIDYATEFVQVDHGHTYGDRSGSFVLDGRGYSVYSYVGSMRPIQGELHVIN